MIEDITKVLFFAIEDPAQCVVGREPANITIFLNAYEAVRPLSDLEKLALPVLSQARFLYEYLKYHLHRATNPDAAVIRTAKQEAYTVFKSFLES